MADFSVPVISNSPLDMCFSKEKELICASHRDSFAIKEDGSIIAFGDNSRFQCDIPDSNSDFVSISSKKYYVLGLKSNGYVSAWGIPPSGIYVPSPNEDFIAVASGEEHSLGLKSNGSIVAWGDNSYNQCDIPNPNSGFIKIAAGAFHSLGLKSDGSIVAWGNNSDHQCDIPLNNTNYVYLSAGDKHSAGLKSDGSVVLWGSNFYGQSNTPDQNNDFVDISLGYYHTLGLRSNGSIVAWGKYSDGQCDVPQPNNQFVAVSGGKTHSIGLKIGGKICTWGNNSYNQCDIPNPNQDYRWTVNYRNIMSSEYTIEIFFPEYQTSPTEELHFVNGYGYGRYSYDTGTSPAPVFGDQGLTYFNVFGAQSTWGYGYGYYSESLTPSILDPYLGYGFGHELANSVAGDAEDIIPVYALIKKNNDIQVGIKVVFTGGPGLIIENNTAITDSDGIAKTNVRINSEIMRNINENGKDPSFVERPDFGYMTIVATIDEESKGDVIKIGTSSQQIVGGLTSSFVIPVENI